MGVFDQRDYSYEVKQLLDGSSKEMDVNGSGTPDVFSYTASGVEYVDKVTMLLQDPGSMDVRDFGSISGGLSNGLLIEYQSVGSIIQFANLEDNGDIATTFSNFWAPVNGEDGLGFLDDEDTIVASYIFPQPIELESGDFFRATVRDNLNGISFLRMSIMIRKVLD